MEGGKRHQQVAGRQKKQQGEKVAAAAAAAAAGVAGDAAESLAVGTAAEGCCWFWEPHLQCIGYEMSTPRQTIKPFGLR